MIEHRGLENAKSMIPVNIGDNFGWFHPASSDHAGDTAILLCQGSGQDFSNGYRPFRVLAENLAKAGYPSLRFDYPGTGDSANAERENLWEAWQESLSIAATWLRTQTGAAQLLLIGLRIGGTLAAMAAEQLKGVAGLVLIEPCLTGRTYISQLVAEARLRGVQQSESGLEAGELYLTAACIRDMREVELSRIALPFSLPVIIFSRLPEDKFRIRLKNWQEQNIHFSYEELGDLEAVLRPNHHCGEPELDPGKLLEWIRCNIPQNTPSSVTLPLPVPEAFILPNCIETSLSFGTAWHLTGILCRPRVDKFPGFSVIICNSGGNPHHGFARFGVECARSLAEAGVASLRFDFAGLGDSIYNSGGLDLQTDVFTEDRNADISAALDALEAVGFRYFALHGLCSGAYHALQAACTQKRVVQLLAVNLPWFTLQNERPGPTSLAQNCIKVLACHGVASFFLFGQQDTGLKQFERHFGVNGTLLPASPAIRACVLAGLDHELTASWMRKQVVARIIDFVQTHQTQVWSPEAEGVRRYGHA